MLCFNLFTLISSFSNEKIGIVGLITQDLIITQNLLDQVDNLTNWHLKEILHLRKIDIWKSNIPRKLIDSINLQSTKSITDLRYIFCQSYYIISTIFSIISNRSWDLKVTNCINFQFVPAEKVIPSFFIKFCSPTFKRHSPAHAEIIDFKDTTKDDLQDRINIFLINEKLINKINRNLNS